MATSKQIAILFFLTGLGSLPITGADAPYRFVDAAESWGLQAHLTYGSAETNVSILETTGTGVAILDYDSDGDNDVVIVNGATIRSAQKGGAPLSKLCRNDDGRFTDVAREVGLTRRGWGQGVCVGDYGNDGNTELAMGYFGSPALYRNLGGGKFNEAAAKSGLRQDGRWSAACAFLDYDNDGLLDLFFSSYIKLDPAQPSNPDETPTCNWHGIPALCGPRGMPLALNSLYRNIGGGRFEEVSEIAGILAPGGRYGLGVTAADFNNDNRIDIYVACDMTPRLLYINQGDGTFDEVGSRSGAAFSMDGQLQAGMGVAVADYDSDGDGRPEVVIVNVNDKPAVLRNNARQVNFFWIQLQGAKSNRRAIGARVTITANGRTQMREVTGGSSYYSQSDLAPYLGLGGATRIESIEVRWPSGVVQEIKDVAANKRYRLVEGGALIEIPKEVASRAGAQ